VNEYHDDEQFQLRAGDLLTVEETARLLRLTTSGVMRLKDREQMPAYKVGSRWLFNRHELALWLVVRRIDGPMQ
jgi:excisionase family DNA binding protein